MKAMTIMTNAAFQHQNLSSVVKTNQIPKNVVRMKVVVLQIGIAKVVLCAAMNVQKVSHQTFNVAINRRYQRKSIT